MESGQSSPTESQRPVSGISKQRACDECRTRKIRCDRKVPCSHCRAANLACRTTNERPKERKARVIISKEYESKIDGISSRLDGIEHLLRSALKATPLQSSPVENGSTGNKSFESGALDDGPSDPAPFSGFTGPTADSSLAQEVVEQTVGGSLDALSDETLRTALHSLGQVVSKMKADATEPSLKPLHEESTTSSEDHIVPEWHVVQPLLERAQLHSSATFLLSFPSTTISEFAQKCQALYEQNQSAPPPRRLLVYAGLYWLAAEFSALDSEASSAYYAALSKRFQNLVLRVLTNFPLIIPACTENVEALMAGSCFAIDICRPSLSQTLTCAAARNCQILGYHRFSSMANDSKKDRERKTMLFWFVYLMDKMISLRLGHASAIQDFEISLPKPQPSEIFSDSLVLLMNFWIDVARVQGQICEQLYSPAALTQSSNVRSNRAERLAYDLKEAYEARLAADDTILAQFSAGGATAELMAKELISGGDTIVYYSTLTSILHAVPVAQPGISPAVETARMALKASPDMSQYEHKSDYFWILYCHWVTLNTPLTPFTVLFCHIIANYNDSEEDLKLLERFVRSLHRARSVSDGVERLFQLCSVFWNVAKAYVQVKDQEAKVLHDARKEVPPSNNQVAAASVTGDFDEYLSALGLAPQPTQIADSTSTAFQLEEDISNYLQNFYTGNASLYGLLEQDLGNISGFGMEDYSFQEL